MKINIPFYKQKNEYYCGPAVLQMVFEFLGIKKTQEQLAEALGTTEELGTTNKAMSRVTSRSGFSVVAKEGMTIDEVKDFLNNGLPVIVDFIEPKDSWQHFAILKGHEDNNLIFNDSTNGEDFIMSEDDFLSRWHDPNKGYKQWAMVISRPPKD